MEGKPSFAERRNCPRNERAIRVLVLLRKLELGGLRRVAISCERLTRLCLKLFLLLCEAIFDLVALLRDHS